MAKHANNGTHNMLLLLDPPNLVQGVLHEDKNAYKRSWQFNVTS